MTLEYFRNLMPSVELGLDWSIRATAVFATAGLVVLLLRQRSAASRHFVWSMALIGAIVLPLVMATVPGWNVPSWSTAQAELPQQSWLAFHPEDQNGNLPASDAELLLEDVASTTAATQSISISPTAAVPSVATSLEWTRVLAVLPILWCGGAAVMLLGVAFGFVSLWRLRRTASPLPAHLADECAQLTSEIGLRRRVAFEMTCRRTIPMTWGAIHPVVLMPAEVTTWTRDRRRMVLLHELARIQRWDFAVQLLGQVSRALHWFNPLAWWALSQLRLEQERACDDCVLNAGESATDYATELVNVTARLPRLSWDAGVALAIRRFARIEQRLKAILDAKRDRQPVSLSRASLIGLLLAGIVSLVALPRLPDARADETQAAATTQEPAKSQTGTNQDKTIAAPVGEQTLSQVSELIRKNFSSEIDPKRLNEAAIKGMLEALNDPHSSLVSSEDFRELQQQLDGKIVGIGAQLAREQDAIVIVTPLPNSPAIKAGVKPRDVILSVNGTKPADLKEAVIAIRGPQGSEVKLRLRRGDQELDLTVKRDTVQLEAVRGLALNESGEWQYWFDPEAKLAYLRIAEFNHSTSTDLDVALSRLQERGLKGLVLDLRGCPGGLLESCVKAASAFIKSGNVASIRGRQQLERKFDVDGSAKYSELPLVVLIDEVTASAGEVLAAALQDHSRAVLVGERTFGKGSVQSLIPVGQSGANLKLTTAQIHRPNGAQLHRTEKADRWGVDPNDGCFVPLSKEQRSSMQERRLQRDTAGQLKLSATLTPALVTSELADPVLAAGLQALSAKVKTGEFQASGRPLAEMQQQLANRDVLRVEREELLRKLREIDQQLLK